jgi:hypothetical protein
MWKDAPENPNRGKDPKARKPRITKKKVVAADDGEKGEPSSDD